MKVGKPKSKRVPVRLRHKIQKASAAKQKKDRKLAKKNPEWRSRLKKDPGIPNLFPYKAKLLHEIEENKRRKEEDAQRRKEEARARREGLAVDAVGDQVMADEQGPDVEDDDDDLVDYAEYSDEADQEADEAMIDDSSNPMAALLASARARAQQYDNEGLLDHDGEESDEQEVDTDQKTSQDVRRKKDGSRHAYDKTFKEVVAASDVILYVLDARDPEGTRSKAVEREIVSSPDKRLILVLNKIDLIPARVIRDWLVHLRQSFPALPLRTTSPSSSGTSFDHPTTLTSQSTSTALLKALKSWASGRENLKRPISVGVLGYPNVGKSSVINALTSLHSGKRGASSGGTACPVGATAGLTTAMRTVKIDSRLTLLDSPGIVFPSSDGSVAGASVTSASSNDKADGDIPSSNRRVAEQARLVLLNALPPKDIEDPQPAVTLLLRRLDKAPGRLEALLGLYGIPPLMPSSSGVANKDFTTDFLVQVARKRGRLGKGGVPNLHSAAMVVINDWREGKIQGWVEPPKVVAPVAAKQAATPAETPASAILDQKVVSQWADEFKLDGLWGDDSAQ